MSCILKRLTVWHANLWMICHNSLLNVPLWMIFGTFSSWIWRGRNIVWQSPIFTTVRARQSSPIPASDNYANQIHHTIPVVTMGWSKVYSTAGCRQVREVKILAVVALLPRCSHIWAKHAGWGVVDLSLVDKVAKSGCLTSAHLSNYQKYHFKNELVWELSMFDGWKKLSTP